MRVLFVALVACGRRGVQQRRRTVGVQDSERAREYTETPSFTNSTGAWAITGIRIET